jgi:hypothetical protein
MKNTSEASTIFHATYVDATSVHEKYIVSIVLIFGASYIVLIMSLPAELEKCETKGV